MQDAVITIRVAYPPKPPEKAILKFFTIEGRGRREEFGKAVAFWIRCGIDNSLYAIAHEDLGCVDGTSSQNEWESEWDGEKWSEWNSI